MVAGVGTVYLISTFKETKRTADAAVASVLSARQATKAAIEANRHSREAFNVDFRPWVTVSYEMVDAYWSGYNFCWMKFKFTMQNIGKTPAMNVDVVLKAFPNSERIYLPQEQGNIEEVARVKNFRSGGTILPGQAISRERSVSIDMDEVKEGMTFVPAVVGSVIYSSSWSDDACRTGFIFHVHNMLPNGILRAIPFPRDFAPVESLRLVPYEQDGRVD